jgi:catechol-2,3-dioxygenase
MSSSPAPVTKLGFLEMRTSDVPRLVSHYQDVLNLEVVGEHGPTTYLTCGPDGHCLAISQGEPSGRSGVGYQVGLDLDEVERLLKGQDLIVERRSDMHPDVTDALVIEEPSTGTPLTLYRAMANSAVSSIIGTRPNKLGHVAAFAPEVAGIQAFYQDVLGFRWSDTVGDFFVFMRCGPDHHAANFMASAKYVGLHHVAFEARDISHFKDILDHFAQNRVRLTWGPGRHGPGHNIFSYHDDPDGNNVEIFTEIDVMFDEDSGHWEPRPWHEEFPMGPKVWPLDPATVNQWGPIVTEKLEH